MTHKVADLRANLPENIRHAATVIGRSKHCRAVFEEIYRGNRQIKTVEDLMRATGLGRVRVLQEAGKLAGNQIVEKTKVNGLTAYKKDEAYVHHKGKVLAILDDPKKTSRYPTKQEPRVAGGTTYHIKVGGSTRLPQAVTIDEIESFAKVKAHPNPPKGLRLNKVPEVRIKRFLKRVIGERFEHGDWGGEKSDLFTNKLRFRGRRRYAAFALKGKATAAPLTPKKMGKNGDQIGRLVMSEAQLFFVVFHGKVDQSVHEQLHAFAIGRALGGSRVYHCVIDGDDLARLVGAYPAEYEAAARR